MRTMPSTTGRSVVTSAQTGLALCSAIMRNCGYTDIGVWSENSLERTVVVAVYGTAE